jgi:hypothetical protein
MLSFFVMLYRDLNRATARLTEAGDWQARALSITLEVSLISFLLCAFFLHALQQKIWWILAVLAVSVPLYQLGAAESAQKGAAPPEPARPHGS